MTRARAVLLTAAAILGAGAAAVDWKPSVSATTLTAAIDAEHGYISAPELASRIVAGDAPLHVIDLRTRTEFEQLHVPGAKQIALDELSREPLPTDAMVVVYSDDDGRAARAWRLLRSRGFTRVSIVREGIYEWVGRVLEPRLALDATQAERVEFARAAELSRFFGGLPLSGVPRADVPAGYWTGAPRSQAQLAGAARRAIASIRRRGC